MFSKLLTATHLQKNQEIKKEDSNSFRRGFKKYLKI